MSRNNKKHLTKRERKALHRDPWLNEKGEEPFITMKGARFLVNAMIDQGDTTLERSLPFLQSCDDKMTTGKPSALFMSLGNILPSTIN
jgi:hypothetical protein